MFCKTPLVTILFSIIGASNAWQAPSYDGYRLVWEDPFVGPGGSTPHPANWNIINGNLGVNGELQTYSPSNRNVQLSGGTTLQLVPWRDASAPGGWTSGRVESKYTFIPQPGKVTHAESMIRLGSNPLWQKQGIWPAFWMLGDVLRHGGTWPACGEIDILENLNGLPLGYGTLHCDRYPGGICGEPSGIGASIYIPDMNNFHLWRVEIDRTPYSWMQESIKWSLDGQVYHTITGAQVNDWNTWRAIAYSPLYYILNVAVGGTWPGYPNNSTVDGYGAMLEAGYVATYSTL